jgi:biotin transport system substrate-specific component
VFAAFIAALSLAPAIALGNLVPITLQTLAVAVTAVILGPWRGALAALLYVVVGLAGLPVFAGGAAGLATLAKPSAGYLVAFPLAALLTGWLAQRSLKAKPAWWVLTLTCSAVAGIIVLTHAAGIAGLMLNADLGLGAAVALDLTFLPCDLAKCVIAGGVGAAVHRAFPALLARRAAVPAPVPDSATA